jgi:hypothetical protein
MLICGARFDSVVETGSAHGILSKIPSRRGQVIMTMIAGIPERPKGPMATWGAYSTSTALKEMEI